MYFVRQSILDIIFSFMTMICNCAFNFDIFRFIVIDGNEKNYRAMCMADKTRIIGERGEVNSYNLCTRNPVRGNQYQKQSKFCDAHINGSNTVPDALDMRPVTRQYAKNLPSVVTSGKGCKRDDMVNRFTERSAGMFYVFRPCGIRLTHWEMFTAESLSSTFTGLVDLFNISSQTDLYDNLRGIVYDRSCDLLPFIKRLAAEGNSVAAMFLNLEYIVDLLHAEKHTEPKCVIGNPACEYHPHLENFAYV